MRRINILLILLLGALFHIYAQDASFYYKYAQKGDKEAMYNLALCYFKGTGNVSQDYSQGIVWLSKAAKKKYAPAQLKLGQCYIYGLGVLTDYDQGLKLCLKAAEKDYPPALYIMSELYKSGIGVPKNLQKEMEYLYRASNLGNPDAQWQLGNYFLYGDEEHNIVENASKAFSLTKQAADQDHPSALFNLGLCYKFGIGTSKNQSEAINAFLKSANSGNDMAQAEMGNNYLFGDGVEQNLAEAQRYIDAAIEQENGRAFNLKGDLYYYGWGVTQDYRTASEWYKKGVEQGVSFSYSQLAYMYLSGQGVLQNYAEGFRLYKELADAEYESGQAGIGMCYEYGYGTTEDMFKAVEYYKKAGEQGNGYSLHQLYSIYKQGKGIITKNTQLALQYLRKGADIKHGPSLYAMGYEYLVGEITQQDDSKALEYFNKAVEENFTFANAVLGLFYYDGEPLVKKDYNKAFQLLSKAIEDPSSINENVLADVYKKLGACYRFGRGTEVNQSLAAYYTEQAAKYGDQQSLDVVKKLRK